MGQLRMKSLHTGDAETNDKKDYDDSSDSSVGSNKSSRALFQDVEAHVVEADEDYDKHSTKRKRRRSLGWLASLDIRRKKLTENLPKEGKERKGVNESGYGKKKSRRKTWCTYCSFCGIGVLTVIAILLGLNLGLVIATYKYTADYFDPVLRNWGAPNSGTEGLAWYPTNFTRDVIPIPCHSHNDYWRHVPLFTALRAGCTGTEADVWLKDGELYIGHNHASLTVNRTLQSLYINPLVKILEDQNPHSDFYNGTSNGVFDEDPGRSLILLIDVKTSGVDTWPWVLRHLEPLRERGWLTFVENGTVHNRPITVVGTGNTPFDVLTANTTYRDAFFDAPLNLMWEPLTLASASSTTEEDDIQESSLPTPATPSVDAGQGMTGITASTTFDSLNSYYASVSFNEAVGKLWRGKLTRSQIKIIRGQIRGAHRRGLKVRYWDTPGWPIGLRNHVWDVLVKEGADMLNVDDVRAASRMDW